MKLLKGKKKVSEKDRRMMTTAFLLMFPSFLIAMIATYSSNLFLALVSISLALYQFALIKEFIKDYWKMRE